jgi:hypothetical protein
MRRLRTAGVLVALSLLAGAASAQKPKPKPKPVVVAPKPPPEKPKFIEVTVTEIAGGRAYLQPGTQGGVRRTATVQIRGKEYRVVEATESFAVIEVADESVKEKEKGRASIVEDEEGPKAPPPPPRPLTTFENAWTPEEPPADQQQVAFVPLGEVTRDRRYDVRLGVTSGGFIPIGDRGASIGLLQIDARVHAAPFSVPAALDFDGSLRFWSAADLSSRVGGTTRSVVQVRELLASYGSSASWYAGLGRMRYAASTLGTLDGLRLQAPITNGITVGAFGGLLPNPLGGELNGEAQRFGVEVKLARPESKLRPEAALVAHGSMFGGRPDERRLSAMFGLYPGHSRFGGHIEVSNFDPNNPWKANPVELTAAGIDQSVRVGPFDFGGRFDVIQPERSRWLASYLPASWFCRTVPGSGPTPDTETCDGRSSMRAIGALNAGMTAKNFSITVGGTLMGDITHTASDPRVYGAFASARLVRIAKVLRFEATANYSDASSIRMGTGSGGVGLTLLGDALDVSVYYRRAELLYTALNGFVHHDAVGGMVVVTPHPTMMFTVQGEGTGGSDANSLFIFGTALWRPRL